MNQAQITLSNKVKHKSNLSKREKKYDGKIVKIEIERTKFLVFVKALKYFLFPIHMYILLLLFMHIHIINVYRFYIYLI